MSWMISNALMKVYENSHFSQAREGGSWEESSSDGAPSAQLNVMPTQQQFWHKDKMMESSNLSRFGLTLQLLTADRGKAVLTWFLAAFPAKISAVKGGATGSTERGLGSGPKCEGSFVRYDHAACTWKTHQYSLLGDWEPYLGTWPKWGLMRHGECWERTMLAALMKGTASGSLPTPMATDWKGGTSSIRKDTGKQRLDQFRDWCKALHGLTYPIPEHSEAVMMWPIGWSDLKPLATDKYQQWLNSHGKL